MYVCMYLCTYIYREREIHTYPTQSVRAMVLGGAQHHEGELARLVYYRYS